VIDAGVVIGELLVTMRDAELVQPPHEPASAVQQVELVLLPAIDVERLQPGMGALNESPRPSRDSRVKLRVLPKGPSEVSNAATPHGIRERQNESQTSRNPRGGRLGDSTVRNPPDIRPKAGWHPQNVQSRQPGEHVDSRGGDDHFRAPD